MTSTGHGRLEMRPIILALLLLPGPPALAAKDKPAKVYEIPVPPKPDFSSLDWFVGEWTGKTQGRSPQGEIRLSVEYTLERRFMILREEISLASSKTAPGTSESWMGILSPNRGDSGFALRVFSSTGFITRYRVTVDADEIRFHPEGGEHPPPGWLFRRVVTRSSDTEFDESVQAAPPGKAFFDYYTARFSRAPTH